MKKALIALGVIVLLAAVAIGIVLVKVGATKQGKAIYAEEVTRRDLTELVKASGEVNARVKVNISSHLIGKVQRLYVKEGETVRAGQAFLELEKEAFIAARDDWSSRLAMAKNDVQQSRVALADAELKADRARRLQSEGIQSREQLEAAELALASAKLRLAASEEQVTQAQANLTKALDDLAKTTLFAPLAGKVVSLQAKEGEVVVSGTMNNAASVIGIIADLSEILAEVDVDETEITRVRVGQPATLKVDALPDREFSGQVVELGSSGFNRAQQPDVTYFRVKVLFAGSGEDLRPGMSVRADIRTAERPNAVVVPIQAVVRRPPLGAPEQGPGGTEVEEEQVVFTFDGGKAHQRPVETGVSDDTSVEILKGVEPGEKVITGPYRQLKEVKDGEAAYLRKAEDRDDEKSKPSEDDKQEDGKD